MTLRSSPEFVNCAILKIESTNLDLDVETVSILTFGRCGVEKHN